MSWQVTAPAEVWQMTLDNYATTTLPTARLARLVWSLVVENNLMSSNGLVLDLGIHIKRWRDGNGGIAGRPGRLSPTCFVVDTAFSKTNNRSSDLQDRCSTPTPSTCQEMPSFSSLNLLANLKNLSLRFSCHTFIVLRSLIPVTFVRQ